MYLTQYLYLPLRQRGKLAFRDTCFQVFFLNKPRGYITTLEDKYAELKVVDLLPKQYKHLYPIQSLRKWVSCAFKLGEAALWHMRHL